jgi:hypothetical protein
VSSHCYISVRICITHPRHLTHTLTPTFNVRDSSYKGTGVKGLKVLVYEALKVLEYEAFSY